MQRRHHAWILPLRVNPNARTRVLCFPHAGGGTATYRSWAPLASELEVWAVALPGREHRFGEPATSSVRERVARIADDCLEELGAALPVVLFGHSMGALLAFEVARELRRRRASGPLRHRRASVEAMHGWRRHTTGPFEAHAFSGGHLFLHAAREAVLTLLRRAL